MRAGAARQSRCALPGMLKAVVDRSSDIILQLRLGLAYAADLRFAAVTSNVWLGGIPPVSF